MIQVFTIIVTYNPGKWLYKCLSSLANSNYLNKVIIVDNGSTDGSQQQIKDHYKDIDLIQSGTNLGFGKANNFGIKRAYEAGADYILLLNQNAWVEEDTIEKLVNIHQKNPEYAITSPVHLNGAGTALGYGFSNYIVPSKCPDLISDVMVAESKDRLYETFL